MIRKLTFLTLAIVAGALFTMVQAQAQTITYSTLNPIIMTSAAPDATHQPAKSTWGQVRRMYEGDGSIQTVKDRTGATPSSIVGATGFPWNYGDWTSRVAWEARHALSAGASGTSSWTIPDDRYGPRWFGDWYYVASDWYAYNKAAAEATDIGPVTDTADQHHRGGWCTFFVRLILYRATYWAGYGCHLTTPGYPGSVYSWTDCCMTKNYGTVRPGWVFSSPNNHMAIADSRATVNGQIGWYLIDSNYVGGNGYFYIGKHFMPDYVLLAQNYYAWYPSWATKN